MHAPSGAITPELREVFSLDFTRDFSGEDVCCRLVPLVEILRHAGHLDIEVSCAIGDSPIRAVVRHAVKQLVGDVQYWQPRGRFQTIQWFLKRGPRLERDCALRTAGFIYLLHPVVLLVGPDPFSPFLILNALCGPLRVDEKFMRCMDPGMWVALRPWIDFDTKSPLPRSGSDPLYNLLLEADINPVYYGPGALQPQDLEAVEQTLVAHMVLGHGKVADEYDMAAFAEGLFAAHAQRTDLLQTFQGLERDYLAAMCNQRLDSVDELLAHIEPQSGVDHSKIDLTFLGGSDDGPSDNGERPGGTLGLADNIWDSTYEADFEIAFHYYIWQPGHPDTPIIREMVGDEWEQHASDELLRARLFLTMMSGSDLMPVEPHWQIKMVFVHTGVRDPEGGRAVNPIPAPIDIHACFYECTVTIDDGLRNLLDEGRPWDQFQSWLHGALLNPDDYNQA
ncbi:hypothetical protein C8T65DRAFT_748773 [Cerioporus squamosus]|nr:hypothetical protein C8T65DRAFT_748773 [Cerioporus squamosus]